ncbi:hypothetical protein JCM3766R1_005334 [Sporobolomyces carnicolor]
MSATSTPVRNGRGGRGGGPHLLLSSSSSSSSPSRAMSTAPSIAATSTTTMMRPSRRRVVNHARNHVVVSRGGDPDSVELIKIQDADQVFREFSVTDVRRIETRAVAAANDKVDELRTMVGERYRDLLAAADSIVRMRRASDDLELGLERVHSHLRSLDRAHRRQERPTLPQRDDQEETRSLSRAPTLSLTIHLFVNLGSVVHLELERSNLLAAARLRDVGRSIWHDHLHDTDIVERFPIVVKHRDDLLRQAKRLIIRRCEQRFKLEHVSPRDLAETVAAVILVDHDNDDDDDDDDLDSSESRWSSPESALEKLLEARSETLDQLVRDVTSRRRGGGGGEVVIERVVDCFVTTVDAVDRVFFGDDDDDDRQGGGLLANVVDQLETPTGPDDHVTDVDDDKTITLSRILTTVANYPTLSRHLPRSILSYNPTLAASFSDRRPDSSSSSRRRSRFDEWITRSIDEVATAVDRHVEESVVSNLDRAASELARLSSSITRQLSSQPPPRPLSRGRGGRREVVVETARSTLRERLVGLIESRLRQVFTLKLERVVDSLEPLVVDRLLNDVVTLVPEGSHYHHDSAKFLFSLEPPPPPSTTTTTTGTQEPFSLFDNEVTKRVTGRYPLIDRGIERLEREAHEIRTDLESWTHSTTTMLDECYFDRVRVTLEAIVDVLDRVMTRQLLEEEEPRQGLDLVAIEESNNIDNDKVRDQTTTTTRGVIAKTLFVGSFAYHLSRSRSFTRDLLFLGGGGVGGSGTTTTTTTATRPPTTTTTRLLLRDWHSKLDEIHRRSFVPWRQDAVSRSIALLRNGAAAAGRPPPRQQQTRDDDLFAPAKTTTTTIIKKKSEVVVVVNEPSTFLVQALNSLVESIRTIPIHQLDDSNNNDSDFFDDGPTSTTNPTGAPKRRRSGGPARELVLEFSNRARQVAREFFDHLVAEVVGRSQGGRGDYDDDVDVDEMKQRLVWDTTLISLIVQGGGGRGEGGQDATVDNIDDDDEKTLWEPVIASLAQLLEREEEGMTKGSSSSRRDDIVRSTTAYLLRTQSIYGPLIDPRRRSSPLVVPPRPESNHHHHHQQRSSSSGSNRLLKLGLPPPLLATSSSSTSTSSSSSKGLLDVVRPGPRIGLLPTKGLA